MIADTSASRRIHFPAGRSLGKAILRPVAGGAPVVTEARGAISVPPGWSLTVRLEPMPGESVLPLKEFDASGIEGFFFPGETFGEEQAEQLASLDSLRHLEVESHSLSDAAIQRIGALGQLESLRIASSRPIRAMEMRPLGQMTNLRRLVLENIAFEERSFRFVGELRNLRTLWLRGCNLSAAQFEVVGALGELRDILLPAAATDSWMRTVSRLHRIESIEASASALTFESAYDFGALRELQILSLPPGFDNEVLRLLPPIANLCSLSLACTRLTNDGLYQLTRQPELSDLYLWLRLTWKEAAVLARLPKLRRLALLGFDQEVNEALPLRDSGTIEALNISLPGLGDFDYLYFQQFRALKKLTLRRSALSPRRSANFAESIPAVRVHHPERRIALTEESRPRLQLSIRHFREPSPALWSLLEPRGGGFRIRRDCEMRLEIARAVADDLLPYLHMPTPPVAELRLRDTEVTPGMADAIAGFDQLWTLDLAGCKIHANSPAAIAWIPALRKVVLDYSDVTDRGVGFIADSHSIEYIDLAHTGIGAAALEILGTRMPQLKSVNLRGVTVDDEALATLRARRKDLEIIL